MEQTLEVYRLAAETLAGDFDHVAWLDAHPIRLKQYWSGEFAPADRHAEVRSLWTTQALFVRFDCQQYEPLVVGNDFQTEKKTIGLWERDVCEIFIAPDANVPERYFEFEAAPTGEWLDLAIYQMTDKRETDWAYASGMTVAALVENEKVMIGIRIPFEAFDRVPQSGDRWRANLFRCIGKGDQRGYLAWQPTLTDQPNFHVPAVFGWLCFVG